MAPALPHADASDAGGPTKPNKKQDSLAVLEKMVDDLVKEVQGERKRVVAPKEDIATQPNKQHQDKIISPGKRQKIISSGKRGGEPQDSKPIGFGRQAVKLIGVGREVSHSNVGQETLRKLEDLVQKIKRENKRDFVSNDLSNIERSLENRVSSDEKLVESTATKREEKKTEETSSEKPKDRRTLLNELLDTYNEVIGKKSRKTDKYAKELEVESQSISPKGKVSKETAKDLAGFSINGKRESEKSAKLSAEDIINKAREVLNEGFTHKGKPVPK